MKIDRDKESIILELQQRNMASSMVNPTAEDNSPYKCVIHSMQVSPALASQLRLLHLHIR